MPTLKDIQNAHPSVNTLLIIEDDAATRVRLVSIFKRKGFRILEAKTLKEANAIFKQERPDCILMDLHFPDGHSIEDFYTNMFHVQEKRGENPCPVVILTASDAEEDLRELLACGIYTVHSKSDPIDAVEESIRIEITETKRNSLTLIKGGGQQKTLPPFIDNIANNW